MKKNKNKVIINYVLSDKGHSSFFQLVKGPKGKALWLKKKHGKT